MQVARKLHELGIQVYKYPMALAIFAHHTKHISAHTQHTQALKLSCIFSLGVIKLYLTILLSLLSSIVASIVA